jgi:hypothetical protein
MNLASVISSLGLIEFDLADVVSWPALAAGTLAFGLALFGETYEKVEADRRNILLAKLTHRRMTRLGWVALLLALTAVGLSVQKQYTRYTTDREELTLAKWTQQFLFDKFADPRMLNRPVLAVGSAAASEPPPNDHLKGFLPYRPILDSSKPQERIPIRGKALDLVDFEVHCPEDTLDWMCKNCGIATGPNGGVTPLLVNDTRIRYQVARNPEGREEIVLTGTLHLMGSLHPMELAAVGFGRCTKINARVRGFYGNQDPGPGHERCIDIEHGRICGYVPLPEGTKVVNRDD